AVSRACTRLEGIPLAIELAASRIAVLTIEQVAERLDESFRLLAGGVRDGPTRQQTMEAALDWSYALLTGPEQAAFRRLSAFAGGFTLEAAETIAGPGTRDPGPGGGPRVPEAGDLAADPLELLSSLVDKSLVVADRTMATARYRL